MFAKARLLSFLLDTLAPFPEQSSDLLPKVVEQELRCRDVCRGLILNCLNAIRLQANSLAPDSFLRMFLNLHEKWDEELDNVEYATKFQRETGLGLRMLDANKNDVGVGMSNQMSLLSLSFGGMSGGVDGMFSNVLLMYYI